MNENHTSQISYKMTRKQVFLIVLCISPLFFLFAILGDQARGRAACICTFLLIYGTKIFWYLRKHRLFWLTMAIVTLSQIPIIMLNPWGGRSYPGAVLLPIALVDFVIIFSALKLVDKLIRRGLDNNCTK